MLNGQAQVARLEPTPTPVLVDAGGRTRFAPRAGAEAFQASSPDRATRVLLYEATPAITGTTADLVKSAMGERCRIDIVGDASSALRLAGRDVHDLYVVAFGADIEDALRVIGSAAGWGHPVVAVIESVDDGDEFRALSAGASDCIARSELTGGALNRSIRHAVLRHDNASLAVQQRGRLDRETARLDALRGGFHRLALRTCHDIRTPLTVIKTFSSILLGELVSGLEPEQSRFLRTIVRRANDLGHMIDGLLDASELASDLVGAHREAIDPNEMVEGLRAELEQTAADADAELNIRLDDGLPMVFCDRGNIERVMQILVATACKAAGAGATIEIWARSETATKSVKIGVSDNRFHALETRAGAAGGPIEAEGVPRRSLDPALHVISELVRINLGALSTACDPSGGSTSAFTLPIVDLDRILSAHLNVLERGRQTISAVSIALAAATSPISGAPAHQIQELLWSELRASDLVIPLQPQGWALCIACDDATAEIIVSRISASLADSNWHGDGGPPPAVLVRTIGTWPLAARSDHISGAILAELAAIGDGRHAAATAEEIFDPAAFKAGAAAASFPSHPGELS